VADFVVDPSSLTSAGADFHTASQELSDALGVLAAALASTGGMAGADKPGVQFSDMYDAVVPKVEHLVGMCVTGLAAIGDGLRTAAGNYSGSDAASSFTSGNTK
jgi:hypothetical protein